MDLRDRTALVTGGAVRLGAVIVQALAEAGVRVALHYRTSKVAADALCSDIRAQGRVAVALQADLNDPAAVEPLIRAVVHELGPLDILVNNAAVFHKDSFETLDADKLDAEFRVNLFAPLLLMKAFAAQGRPGVIVNLLDRRITSLDPSAVPYELSKKALAEATRVAALHWAPRIRVNAVAPGPALPPPGEGPSYLKEKAGPIPLGRPCAPREIAEAVLYLLRADSVTGQVLFVDGGQHLTL